MAKIMEDQELNESEQAQLDGSEPELEVEDEPDSDEESEQKVEDEESEEQKPDPRERKVPHGAFHEEREKRKAAERERDDTRSKLDTLTARFNDFLAYQRGDGREEVEPEPDDPAPDRVAEPFKYMEWQDRQIAKLRERQDGLEQSQKQQTEQTEQQRQFSQVINYGNNLANQFRASTPDYDEAYKFAYEKRVEQLRLLNYDDNAIPGMIEREKTAGMMVALRQKVNPGEYLYKYAISQGYQPKTTQKNPKLEKVEEGQRKFKSLGGGGERKDVAPGSAEDVARMSEAEFKSWLNKNPRGMRKLMGLPG